MEWYKSLAKMIIRRLDGTILTPEFATNIVRLCLQKTYLPSRLRELLLWPLTTHLLPQNYTDDIELQNGIVMRVGLEDMANRFLLYYSQIVKFCWEPQTARLALQLVNKNDIVIIGGAHIGYHTSLLCNKLQTLGGQVHAFEPFRVYFDRLTDTKTLNSYENLYPQRCALGNKNTNKVRLYLSKLPPSTVAESHTSDVIFEDVDCIALDD